MPRTMQGTDLAYSRDREKARVTEARGKEEWFQKNQGWQIGDRSHSVFIGQNKESGVCSKCPGTLWRLKESSHTILFTITLTALQSVD